MNIENAGKLVPRGAVFALIVTGALSLLYLAPWFQQSGVATSGESTARLWDAATGQQITSSAEFSPDGALLVTMNSDGTGRLWEAATSRPGINPGHHQLNWTFRCGGVRYGFTKIRPLGTREQALFFVWKSRAYRMPLLPRWLIFTVLMMAVAIGYWAVNRNWRYPQTNTQFRAEQ